MNRNDALVLVRVSSNGMEVQAEALVSNMTIHYGFWGGKIARIGNITFEYGLWSGELRRVGNARITYGWGGQITGATYDKRVEIIVQARPHGQQKPASPPQVQKAEKRKHE